jgi:hypothetical protein
VLEKYAGQIKDQMSKVQGIADLGVFDRWASPPCASMSTAKRRPAMA